MRRPEGPVGSWAVRFTCHVGHSLSSSPPHSPHWNGLPPSSKPNPSNWRNIELSSIIKFYQWARLTLKLSATMFAHACSIWTHPLTKPNRIYHQCLENAEAELDPCTRKGNCRLGRLRYRGIVMVVDSVEGLVQGYRWTKLVWDRAYTRHLLIGKLPQLQFRD